MAMTAVAVRMAFWAKEAGFEQWRRGLLGSEESQAQANVKLADLSYEMPELAVAGSGGGDDNDAPADDPPIDEPADESRGGHAEHHRERLADRA